MLLPAARAVSQSSTSGAVDNRGTLMVTEGGSLSAGSLENWNTVELGGQAHFSGQVVNSGIMESYGAFSAASLFNGGSAVFSGQAEVGRALDNHGLLSVARWRQSFSAGKPGQSIQPEHRG